MFDYLNIQGSTENPTMVTILLTVFLSFILASLVAWTYDKTSRHIVRQLDFMQSLVLMAIVAATVMQAIGDSVARGLGMMGALAVIRFRTSINNPRNMVFTFASLAVGIGTGVYGFVIAIFGTLGFCATAFILRYSPMSAERTIRGSLKFDLPMGSTDFDFIEVVLGQHCRRYALDNYQIVQPKVIADAQGNVNKIREDTINNVKLMSYEYQFSLKEKITAEMLYMELSKFQMLHTMKLKFENKQENL